MRALLAVLWIALIGAAWIRMPRDSGHEPPADPSPVVCPSGSPGDASWMASRPMPANWRFGDTDLRHSGSVTPADQLVGRYLACAVTAGQRISVEDSWTTPHVTPRDGKVLARVALSGGVATDANAGLDLVVFLESSQILRARIAAVLCDPVCVGLLETTESERAVLAAADPAHLRSVIVVPATKAP